MKFDIESLLVVVIAVAALALTYVRQQRAAQRDRSGGEAGEETVTKPRKPNAAGRRRPSHSSDERGERGDGGPPSGRAANGAGLFESVRNWGYQLQKVKIQDVAASSFDLMVIDYSADGSDEKAFTRAQVERMQSKPDGSRRIMLSYMSVGEAESYRYYWDPAWKSNPPSWLLDENPEWPENFAVRFWEPGWQRLFFGSENAYLDRIIDAGFDGVYLDKCDVFEDLIQHNKKVAGTRQDIEGDMVEFVVRLSRYAKGRNPRFAIVMQNAEVLLEREALRQAIDGVAKEELLYGLSGPEKVNPKDEVAYSKQALDLAHSAGRTVFVVEYLSDREKMRSALATLDQYGYVGTVSAKNRELDRLNPDPSTIA